MNKLNRVSIRKLPGEQVRLIDQRVGETYVIVTAAKGGVSVEFQLAPKHVFRPMGNFYTVTDALNWIRKRMTGVA